MNSKHIIIATLLVAGFCFTAKVSAQLNFDVEGGIASTVYNDVRIPGEGGTFFSLSDDFVSKNIFFSRIRGGYQLGRRSELLALFAPLEFEYKGSVNKNIIFQGETYPAGTVLNATYKFNSYRLTYRYYILKKEKLTAGVGLTVKVRDALIGLRGGGLESQKTDLGLVPLINFNLHWKPLNRLGILVDGDALAAPQGRAEDVLVALTFRATNNFSVKAGYRILEGGADGKSVYTFSMFSYGVLGATIDL
ncbi:MAG TPA: hypothetical protein PL017_09230 [Tenuifilaceae bacterium]|nr:hypothetical protein [Tenuifilaceae bacterium]HPE18479.1 hypothetical protein [Tenuifilaceae bacterium]HPJ46268.1 hypothetical protein [Tenuifilaceae bacterium]HPQ34346.1 hypothetical protein [Tenuifilaceae bacterium]HRX68891.1 hypothetical protein [Tenuifilaceae bacterium]